MKKLKLLSSTLVMAMVSVGAYAADDNFITGGAGTCTVDVLKVSDNNATANTIAVWTPVTYECAPGQYLVSELDGTVGCTMCPTGSYCPGGNYTVEDDNKGTEPCPSGYAFSDAGAKSNTQCYTACTVANANIAHATAVSGNDYYGTGVDTCSATDCELGYHVEGGGVELVEQTPLIPVDYTETGSGYASIGADGSKYDYQADIVPEDALTSNGTWASVFDYGVVYGKASCQPQMNPAAAYVMSYAESVMGGEMSMEDFKAGLEPLAGPLKTALAIDTLKGVMNGTKTAVDMLEAFWVGLMSEPDANYTTDSTGQYCYCQMDGFSPMDGAALGAKEIVTSAPWVFIQNTGSAGCASYCAANCASTLRYDAVANSAFRAAVFGAFDVVESGAICAANKINIDWNPNNGGEHIEGMCYYNDAITLPAEPTKPGYTFTGWKLDTTAKTE